ncbi:hypothetical protein PBY51_005803 [Eleginops maclovinus]|uniref:Uncharacterized protein n=1 Tax=Eleginops maclovinus TaxID=56733 RepID=A0AAN7WVI1_ELEMC|nr:hypothetical protein PBY51_005803 [Eleginops maclovinus]
MCLLLWVIGATVILSKVQTYSDDDDDDDDEEDLEHYNESYILTISENIEDIDSYPSSGDYSFNSIENHSSSSSYSSSSSSTANPLCLLFVLLVSFILGC